MACWICCWQCCPRGTGIGHISCLGETLKPVPTIIGLPFVVGQNTAFLTRIDPVDKLWRSNRRQSIPIPESRCNHSGTVDKSVSLSKHYFARFQVGAVKLLVAGIHLIAFPTEPSRCVQREGQAQLLSKLLRKYNRKGDHALLVLGDFNDFDDACIGADNRRSTSSVHVCIPLCAYVGFVAASRSKSSR